MRVACTALNRDFGIQLEGSAADVNYTLRLGALNVSVDWNVSTGNGASLTSEQLRKSGVLDLAAAVSQAAGVWYNLTKDKDCFEIGAAESTLASRASNVMETTAPSAATVATAATVAATLVESPAAGGPECPACPPCDDCPPCPVSYCNWEDTEPCTYTESLSKT